MMMMIWHPLLPDCVKVLQEDLSLNPSEIVGKTFVNLLGWHLCRTELPRKACSSKTKCEAKSETKSLKNAPNVRKRN